MDNVIVLNNEELTVLKRVLKSVDCSVDADGECIEAMLENLENMNLVKSIKNCIDSHDDMKSLLRDYVKKIWEIQKRRSGSYSIADVEYSEDSIIVNMEEHSYGDFENVYIKVPMEYLLNPDWETVFSAKMTEKKRIEEEERKALEEKKKRELEESEVLLYKKLKEKYEK